MTAKKTAAPRKTAAKKATPAKEGRGDAVEPASPGLGIQNKFGGSK